MEKYNNGAILCPFFDLNLQKLHWQFQNFYKHYTVIGFILDMSVQVKENIEVNKYLST